MMLFLWIVKIDFLYFTAGGRGYIIDLSNPRLSINHIAHQPTKFKSRDVPLSTREAPGRSLSRGAHPRQEGIRFGNASVTL